MLILPSHHWTDCKKRFADMRHTCPKKIKSPVERVAFGGVPEPGSSVSEAPEEADVGPVGDPTRQRDRMVEQDGGPVEEPVEPHRPLNPQREHVRGGGAPPSEHDHHHIVPASKRRGEIGWAFAKTNSTVLSMRLADPRTCRACRISW